MTATHRLSIRPSPICIDLADGTKRILRAYGVIFEDLGTTAVMAYDVTLRVVLSRTVPDVLRRCLSRIPSECPIVVEVAEDWLLAGISLDAVASEFGAMLVPGPSTKERSAAIKAREASRASTIAAG